MKQLACRFFGVVCLLGILTSAAGGQPASDGSDKLVAQGNTFRSNGKLTEALWAYRQAAKAGNVKGAFAAGDMLFAQGQSDNGRERVLKLSEGIGYLYFAATNRHPQACAKLANALKNGIGIQTNLTCAYAWLKLAAQYNPSYKPDLDRLVVLLQPEDVLQAQKIAAEYISGHWPDRVARPVDQGDSRLTIQGVSVNGNGSLIILNGGTLKVGEMINVAPVRSPKHAATEKLVVSCFEIGADYALVAVAGEPNLKMLSVEPR
ncbi:MAG: hypothetical protein PHY43_04870 [Verrucomicrobiales bacterium]|nr:hypothetical protein [Verrucomicrobiales bacterium]